MAFVPTLQHELASVAFNPKSATSSNPFNTPIRSSPRPSADISTQNTVQDVLRNVTPPAQSELGPEPAQQVFERAPLPETNRPRQLAVTTLIVLSNLIQVCAPSNLRRFNMLK